MDNNNFITSLDQTTTDILSIVNTCTTEQLHHKQGGKWNILEILEHLYLTDKVIYAIISRPSEAISSSPEIMGKEAIQKVMVEQRGEKIPSPDILKPKGEVKDLATLVNMFESQRDTWKNALLKKEILIDNRVHKHPFLGEMTIRDWLNFAIHHTQRHLEQMKEMMNNQ